ncbi:MAG: trypsin-like peptidase domain-containing protein [Acidimicrobiales bacterium]
MTSKGVRVGAELAWPVLVMAVVAGAAVLVLLAYSSSSARPDASSPDPSGTDVVGQAYDSAVLVQAIGCRFDSVGAGVAVDGGVVTNAHVVAGATDVRVHTTDGDEVRATVVAFDPRLDLAVLDAPGLLVPALELGAPAATNPVVVLSRGEDTAGEPVVLPVDGNVERTINIFIADIYGDGRYERRGLELIADLGPGDSGAGIIDSSGQMVGVVFSTSRRQREVVYAISATEVGGLIARTETGPVDTGECLR